MGTLDLEPTLVIRPRTSANLPPRPHYFTAAHRRSGVLVLRSWRPAHPPLRRDFTLSVPCAAWVLDRLVRGQHHGPRRHVGWVSGRLVEVVPLGPDGGHGLLLRHTGWPTTWTGWRETIRLPAAHVGEVLLALSRSLHTTH